MEAWRTVCLGPAGRAHSCGACWAQWRREIQGCGTLAVPGEDLELAHRRFSPRGPAPRTRPGTRQGPKGSPARLRCVGAEAPSHPSRSKHCAVGLRGPCVACLSTKDNGQRRARARLEAPSLPPAPSRARPPWGAPAYNPLTLPRSGRCATVDLEKGARADFLGTRERTKHSKAGEGLKCAEGPWDRDNLLGP